MHGVIEHGAPGERPAEGGMPPLSSLAMSAAEATSIRYNTMLYEQRAAGRDVIAMSLGEAYFDLPRLPWDGLPYPEVYHYSHSRGIPELRAKVAAYQRARFGVAIDADSELLLTAGSKAAIYLALLAILEPGDEVIYSEPAWVSYPEQIRLCRGVAVGMPFDVPVDAVDTWITERTKAIIVTNPHNPRGQVYSREELARLLAITERRGIWLLCDEAYSDFVVDGSFVSLGNVDVGKRNGIVFNSLSKNLGISGWRIGYLFSNPELVYAVLKLNQHLITCPPTILQHYVARHFDALLDATRPQIETLARTRRDVADYMRHIGLQTLAGTSTFYFFISIAPSKLDSEAFCDELLERDAVCMIPGIGYGESCEGFIRASIGTATPDEMKHALDRVRALIDRTS